MRFKSITTIILLSLVAASLMISGCTNNTNTTNTATTSPSAHDALLEKYVNVTQTGEYSNKSREVVAWLVTWNNDTSVTILHTVRFRNDNSSVSYNITLIKFQSTQDATNYLKSLDKSGYSLISTSFKTSDVPNLRYITGHDPSVYVEYQKTEGSVFDLTYKGTWLTQYDNIIYIQSGNFLSLGSGASGSSSQPISISSPSLTPTPTSYPNATPTFFPTATPTSTPTPTSTIRTSTTLIR